MQSETAEIKLCMVIYRGKKLSNQYVLYMIRWTFLIHDKLTKMDTDADKLNEVVASKADFRLVDCVDGHIESFVHG